MRNLVILFLGGLLIATTATAGGPGLLKFDEDSISVLEEAGVVRVFVERSQGEDGAVTVDYQSTTEGSATAGADYTPVSGTLSWGDQDESDLFFDVPILDDGEAEGAETIGLVLTNPTGGAGIFPGRGTSTIFIQASDGGTGGDPDDPTDPDDEPGTFKFDEDRVSVVEESGVITIFVERSQGENGAVSVDYASTTGGSATPDADYTPVSGTLTWANGDGSAKSFTLPILDDDEEEGAETIALALSNPTGGAILSGDRSTSTVVILASDGGTGGDPDGDDDEPGRLKFDEDSFEVLESAGVVLITVERSQGEGGAVTVDYVTSDGTATDGSDYTGVTGTLTWANGDGGSKTFAVPILDDAEDEATEHFDLALINPTGGAIVDPLRGTAIARILDNDGAGDPDDPTDPGDPGVFKFDEISFEVLESSGVAIITVERSMGETGVATVDYATSDGTATDGSDYTGVTGTLTWAAGDGADKTFVVPILDDTVAEGVETVDLTLSNPTGGAVVDSQRGTSVLRILANDGGTGDPDDPGTDPGVIRFDNGTYQVLEGAGVALVTVERSMGEDGPASVAYQTFAGTATDGLDYAGVSGTLVWAAGDGSNKTIAVPILDDTLAEGNESLDLRLFDAIGAGLDSQRADAVLTIVDDDTTSCQPNASTLCLLGGRFRVEVDWRTGQGLEGPGTPVAISDRSGLFWFFRPDNLEMLIKVLDACQTHGQFWVFFSMTTNLGVDVLVTDTVTGQSKVYTNTFGVDAKPVRDVTTFTACTP